MTAPARHVVPPSRPESSSLLRMALADRFFRVWELDGDGDFSHCRAEKEEFDGRVAELLASHSRPELVEIARRDRALLRGSTYRGPYPFDPDTGDLRVVAVRMLELELYQARRALDDAALAPATADDFACATVPGLWGMLTERHRLLPLTPAMVRDRRGFSDRVLVVGEYGLFPHPALRDMRECVQELCALAADGHMVQMAIDPHRVIQADQIQDVGLFDYWWGLKLTREDLDDVHATGTTLHARVPGSEVDHTYPLLSTSFRWRANGALKELEVQEAVPADSWNHSGSQFVINRYAHSIRDTTQHAFVHLDGAAKAFPKSEYAVSAEDPNAATGTPLYRKLFRLDGELTDDLWGCVLSHFFRENEHIHEYFGEILDERPQAAVA